jgi:hypothetical protein
VRGYLDIYIYIYIEDIKGGRERDVGCIIVVWGQVFILQVIFLWSQLDTLFGDINKE